jgi:hypothetical protein
MTKARDPPAMRQHARTKAAPMACWAKLVTRVNSANVLDEGLGIGGRATTRDSGIEIGTRCTQVHVPTVEDRYILLAI